MNGVIALARRVPRAALGVRARGLCQRLAASSSISSFQVPDESGHVVYAQHLAETVQIPDKETVTRFRTSCRPPWSQLRFNDVVGGGRATAPLLCATRLPGGRGAPRRGPIRPTAMAPIESSNQPPLYYSLAAAAYLVLAVGRTCSIGSGSCDSSRPSWRR